MNGVLYLAVVLIWGTTWIAITAQHGLFSPVIAVFWRFVIAAGLLFLFLLCTGRLKKLDIQDHVFCALQGLCIFGFNFICFYTAIAYINSGLESVIFSMAVLFNAINSRIFFSQKISAYFLPAASLGFFGIVALFWHDVVSTQVQWQTLFAIGLCMLGTYGFSLGNMISIRHQKKKLDVFTTNAYGMLYGAALMAIIGYVRADSFLPTVMSTHALGALIYLAVVGSIVGFSAYFILIKRIGAGQAAYSTLLFPLVALVISTIWENYQWHLGSYLGVIFILLGNYILFKQPQWLRQLLHKSKVA